MSFYLYFFRSFSVSGIIMFSTILGAVVLVACALKFSSTQCEYLNNLCFIYNSLTKLYYLTLCDGNLSEGFLLESVKLVCFLLHSLKFNL